MITINTHQEAQQNSIGYHSVSAVAARQRQQHEHDMIQKLDHSTCPHLPFLVDPEPLVFLDFLSPA